MCLFFSSPLMQPVDFFIAFKIQTFWSVLLFLNYLCKSLNIIMSFRKQFHTTSVCVCNQLANFKLSCFILGEGKYLYPLYILYAILY